MPRTTSSANRNEVSFTLNLLPSQLQYLESLKGPLGASSEQTVLREILDQFNTWFRLPAYQREALQKDFAAKKISIVQYIREILARRFEEIRGSAAGPNDSTGKWETREEPEDLKPFAVRMAPSLLAYADKLKPSLAKGSTAEVIREIIKQLERWFQVPRYQAELLDQERVARGLHILEYIQEILARRYEALRDEPAARRSHR